MSRAVANRDWTSDVALTAAIERLRDDIAESKARNRNFPPIDRDDVALVLDALATARADMKEECARVCDPSYTCGCASIIRAIEVKP